MKIGLFTEIYHPVVNGVVSSVDTLRKGLREAGHEVVCIAPEIPSYDDVEASVLRLPSLPLPTRTGYRLTIPVSARWLDARIRVPLDVVHAHSQFITGSVALRYAHAHRIPVVFTYHTRLEFYAHYVPFEQRTVRCVLRARTAAFANRCAAIIVPTQETARYLASLGVRRRIEVVPSAVDVARFAAGRRRADLRERLGVPPRSFLALYCGRLAVEKNVELALRACAVADPRVHLVLAGDGPARAAFEEQVRRLGLERRVVFAGTVPHAEMPDWYASADALLFPSVSETQGIVLVEALAAGLPIVAVDVPQTREVLGGYGMLVPPGPREIAAALSRAMTEPRQSATQLAYERYTVREQARRIIAVYEAARAGET